VGMPAAKQGDKIVGVDIHIVMVPAPPGPPVPTPLPHPYAGTLNGGLSSDVKIMGAPAATVDSTATNTPSHIPTPPGTAFQKPPSNKATVFLGSATVLINGKPAARMGDKAMTCNDPSDLPIGTVIGTGATVLIGGPPSKAGSKASGSSGSGGGGSGGAADGSATGADAAATEVAKSAPGSSDKKDAESPKTFVEFQVKDAKGQAVDGEEYELRLPDGSVKKGSLSGGKVREDDIASGAAMLRLKGLYHPHWKEAAAAVDKDVEMLVEAACYDDGTAVKLEVYREHVEGDGDAVATVDGKVSGGRVRGKWKYAYQKEDAGSRPRFVFHAVVEGARVISGPLTVGDVLDATLKDTDGHVLGNRSYVLYGADGEERKGRTDAKGKIHEIAVAFGPCVVRLEDGYTITEVKK
jgi:uncharacterized Zn-binding protein involved in type VI secretion